MQRSSLQQASASRAFPASILYPRTRIFDPKGENLWVYGWVYLDTKPTTVDCLLFASNYPGEISVSPLLDKIFFKRDLLIRSSTELAQEVAKLEACVQHVFGCSMNRLHYEA